MALKNAVVSPNREFRVWGGVVHRARRVRPVAALAAALLLVVPAGCRFHHLATDLERQEDFGELEGRVTIEEWTGAPVVVAALEIPKPGRPIRVIANRYLLQPGGFEMILRDGSYLMVAFEDLDRDQELDIGERANTDEVVEVAAQDRRKIDIDVNAPWKGLQEEGVEDSTPIVNESLVVVGERARLEDRRFSRYEALVGVWRPLRALERYPAGLFVLDDIDSDRTPVIFVHGIGGRAAEFSKIIEDLDREQFQPWVFQYPSGLRINDVADVLARAIKEMRARYELPSVAVVAHSMGGLVSRRAIGLLRMSRNAPPKCFMSIASPFGGIRSAATGVRVLPVSVPAWRDVAKGSVFLKTLYATPLSPQTKYALMTVRRKGEKDDDVVTIKSQTRQDARDEASVQVEIINTHTGVLRATDAREEIQRFLTTCKEPQRVVERTASERAAPDDQ